MATAGLGGQIWSRPASSEILAKIFDGVHACPRLDSIRVLTVFGDRWQRMICAYLRLMVVRGGWTRIPTPGDGTCFIFDAYIYHPADAIRNRALSLFFQIIVQFRI
ncbi:hypothetical protein PHLCEN_2v423 [Hermanssonia centrifuga]|uniref:Uncharacterized protein n=1 Tax=Hermanssonia centrifuga TaxID=98765 RepID=A0A2R6S5Z7_9APHY|nr:hypothetical protein PHLCEN_2v423 [Hermanssonia centrifuga]